MSKENIELRSEKVRSIIGQIPPRIMRIGISVFFIIFMAILIGTYFFEFDYTIKTSANLSMQGDSIFVQLKIPANQKEIIKVGQKVILNFDIIPNMYGQRLATRLPSVSAIINISGEGGYYTSEFYLPVNIQTETGNGLKINGNFVVNAEILTGKIRFINMLFKPIQEIFKTKTL